MTIPSDKEYPLSYGSEPSTIVDANENHVPGQHFRPGFGKYIALRKFFVDVYYDMKYCEYRRKRND